MAAWSRTSARLGNAPENCLAERGRKRLDTRKAMAIASFPRPRLFLLASSLVFLVLLVACLVVASHEWFWADDIAFLAHVQHTVPWKWIDVFLPIDAPLWFGFRPLGVHTFYYVSFQLHGLEPFGYFASVVAFHFATAPLVYRLGRQLDFEPRIAAVAALLAMSRNPSLSLIYQGAVFHYVAALFFYCLSLSLFLDDVRRPRLVLRVASAVSLALALLCNEFSVSLPPLLVLASLHAEGFALSRSSLVRALRRSSPHFVLAALYLVVSFAIIARAKLPGLCVPRLGLEILPNIGVELVNLAGGPVILMIALTSAAGIVIASALARPRPEAGDWLALLRIHGLLLPWVIGISGAFAAIFWPAPPLRSSLPIEIPAALLFAAYLQLAWRAWCARFGRLLEVGLLVLVVAAIPWHVLLDRIENPRGAQPKHVRDVLEADLGRLKRKSQLLILYGGSELASEREVSQLRVRVYNGAIVHAFFPDRRMTMRFEDVTRGPLERFLCRRCVGYTLHPDGHIEPISRGELNRLLAREAAAAIGRRPDP